VGSRTTLEMGKVKKKGGGEGTTGGKKEYEEIGFIGSPAGKGVKTKPPTPERV